jgi:serine/threonine-protein kinase HipA
VAKRPPLHVWLYGTRVAVLTSTRPGEVICRYTADAVDRWDLNTAVLSCSLPLTRTARRDAGRYFRGLLPEGTALLALASAAGVPTFDTFGMLARFGRDVAGALVIADSEGEPRAGHAELYPRGALDAEVADLEENPLALHDDSELSLAGLQNKMLLVATPQGWARPVSGYPSTHILKVEDRRYPGLVSKEAAALHLARTLGLTTVTATVETFAGLPCIIVSRFDRAVGSPGEAGVVGSTRIHQEDSCQALGRDADAARGRGKYEGGGGPSFADVAELLTTFADDPRRELLRLLAVATFTVAIGNADAHGKNLALLHTSPGVVELAPLYDTVPTMLWPQLRADAAMTINGVTRLDRVTGDDLVEEAARWRLPATAARDVVSATIEQLVAAVVDDAVLADLAELVKRRCFAIARWPLPPGRPASQ